MRMGRYHDVTVIYRWYKDEVENYLRQNGPIPGVTFIHQPDSFYSRMGLLLRKCGSEIGWQYSYKAWQYSSYKLALRMLKEGEHFDLVHQLNGVGIHHPGYMWKLPIPFVWGPTACGPVIRKPLLTMAWSGIDYWKELARNFARKHAAILIPRIGHAARKASYIWTSTEQAANIIQQTGTKCKCGVLMESGCQLHEKVAPKQYAAGSPLNILWSGLFIPRKALPILLRAMTLVTRGQINQVVILGEGPESECWKRMAVDLGVNDLLNWKGHVPFNTVSEYYAKADLFAFTSLREGTPHVILESLGMGLPVLTHDCCGMKYAVTDECGIKVRYETPEISVQGFAAAIRRCFAEKGLINRMSEGALRRAQELTWDKTINQMAETYITVVED